MSTDFFRIFYFFQKQTFGRSCFPRPGSVTACKDFFYIFRLPAMKTDFDERATDDPHHVVEKSFPLHPDNDILRMFIFRLFVSSKYFVRMLTMALLSIRL